MDITFASGSDGSDAPDGARGSGSPPPPMDATLYAPDRPHNELAVLLDRPGPLRVADLSAYDQLHYLGTQALDHAAAELALRPGARVLDVGSGLGGPARYLAEQHRCRVTGVELREPLHRLSTRLTERTGLHERVDLVHADILTASLTPGYDHLLSLLAFLHIPERERLLRVCADALADGATFYIEDFYARRPLTDAERRLLRDGVSCPDLPEAARYRADLAAAGLQVTTWRDATEPWTDWVRDRADRFRADLSEQIRRHGAELAHGLLAFYDLMVDLLAGGGVGGVRITGRRVPAPPSADRGSGKRQPGLR
ncbi:SAM-dependent methyltransferase [Embleya sp. NPDC020886]|uniref:SAM-dependent methyltransferase n=1 Tax=Embleya sp. NPDC020886 TaxID=3363980 RepID=UPI0037B4C68D